jgi:uncharacterized glyoxalase superfamily protein PhnB
MPRILPHLIYDDLASAVAWLEDVFGFTERAFARHVRDEDMHEHLAPRSV